MRSRNMFLMIALAVVASVMAADVMAQPGGGRGGRGGRGGPGFGGFGRGGGDMTAALLNVEAVREEIEMTDEQWADAKKIIDESRGERGGRGDRPNFRDMSEAEREEAVAKMRKEAEERSAKLRKALADVVIDPQFERLDEISLQIQGVAALSSAKIEKDLKISDEQKKDLAKKSEEQQASMREKMMEIFQSARDGGGDFDRDAMRKKMTEMRKEMENEVLGVLSASQKKEFEELKGEPFKMPEGAFGRGRGQGGRGQGGRGGGGGSDRPRRADRPE